MSVASRPEAAVIDEQILEQALHARVLLRCRRALLHEIRNGLQPLHAGLEAISRVVSMAPFPADKAQRYVQLVRQASASQEIALERAVERIAPEQTDSQAVDAAALLREVTRFLNSDAAVAGVRLQVDAPPTAYVLARPHHVRLIALALVLDAIDNAGVDGQLTVSIHAMEDRVLLQFSDTRLVADSAPHEQLHQQVIQQLVARMSGVIDCMITPSAGFTCAVSLLAAHPPAG